MHPPSAYYAAIDQAPDEREIRLISQWLYAQTIRYDFAVPGAALLALAPTTTSQELRQLMMAVKEYLAQFHYISTGQYLAYLSMGRFHQHATSKFHLDGAPDEAFLMLGYEATPVHSELSIADFSRAAHDLGLTPREFLQTFNPLHADHEEKLQPYITRLEGFDSGRPHIALFNNSTLPYTPTGDHTLGVMHQATIIHAPAGAVRTVNTVMLGAVESADLEPVGEVEQRGFLGDGEVVG